MEIPPVNDHREHDTPVPLRVALDTNATYVSRAGIARYVEGLLRAMRQTAPASVEIVPLAWECENFGHAQPLRTFKTAYREGWWGQLVAPALLQRRRTDLLHSTGSLFIRVPRGIRHVVSLHDLSISRHPGRFRPWQISAWHRRLRVIETADRVICSSQFTAGEAMQLLNLPASRIDVVPLGSDWHADTRTIISQPPALRLPTEFFLFVGSLEPGKNLSLLREVWFQAEASARPLPPLVIVGARRVGVAGEGPPPPDWHYLGWQPDEVLLHLYSHALALVFPSVYEGFGLPVIEAMAVGCPVLCSPVSSLPEVAGDSALLATLDARSYGQHLRALTDDSALRADLVRRGLRNADRFTWRRCASETLAVYQSVVRRSA